MKIVKLHPKHHGAREDKSYRWERLKISVEEISTVKKTIRVELPQALTSEEMNHTLEHLQREVRLPGFRPGKVPFSVLKKKFNEQLQGEVLRHLLDEHCPNVIKESGLASVAVGTPEVSQIDFRPDAPLLFTLTVDVIPKIELENYTGLTTPTEDIVITDDDVQEGLGAIQQQQGYLEALPADHSIVLSDYAIVDLNVEVDGKPFKAARRTNYPLQVGSKQFRPEVEEALLGKKRGERVLVSLVVPADDPEAPFAGKNLLFRVEIKEVKIQRLPALDDELAKDLGLASLDALKERVKEALTAERNNRMKQVQKEILVNHLIGAHSFELPQSMLTRELESLSKAEPVSEMPNTERQKQLEAHAARRVKASILLSAIADKEKIEASPEELEIALQRMVRGTGVSLEQARKNVVNTPGGLNGLARIVREEKALERVYSLAKFEPIKKEVAC